MPTHPGPRPDGHRRTLTEKLARAIEQLELQLEDLQTNETERPEEPPAAAGSNSVPPPAAPPVRRPLPEHLPRETHRQEPAEETCPDCGGRLRKLGEDVSEMLESVPAQFKVLRHVRPKLSCTRCERVVETAAPSRPIERGVAGPGLLAHVLVSKYADHLPLYRQHTQQKTCPSARLPLGTQIGQTSSRPGSSGILYVNGSPLGEGMKTPAILHRLGHISWEAIRWDLSASYFHSQDILKLKLGLAVSQLETGCWRRVATSVQNALDQFNAIF
jgi:transposase